MSAPGFIASPHAHKGHSVSRVMGLVLAALTPATLLGLYNFGWPAITLFIVTVGSAVIAEIGALKLAGKPIGVFVTDWSAVLTGWLLAVSLPPWSPWWIGALGAVLAVVIGKHVFGGLGQNVFNPAMVGRVILLISFPLEMTRFLSPKPLGSEGAPGFLDGISVTLGLTDAYDTVSSASILGHVRTELTRGLTLPDILPDMNLQAVDMAVGGIAGSLGETSALLIAAGGIFLIFMRVITWHIPVSMLVTLGVLAALFNGIAPESYVGADIHLLSGATLLGAFFIATDPVTGPVTPIGRIVFGFGLGLLVYVIRTWTAYPEGMAFAVLLMNALAPLIDRYVRPRVYGRDRKGQPLQYPEESMEGAGER